MEGVSIMKGDGVARINSAINKSIESISDILIAVFFEVNRKESHKLSKINTFAAFSIISLTLLVPFSNDSVKDLTQGYKESS